MCSGALTAVTVRTAPAALRIAETPFAPGSNLRVYDRWLFASIDLLVWHVGIPLYNTLTIHVEG